MVVWDLVCILLADGRSDGRSDGRAASFKRAGYECLNLFACSDGLV